MAPSALQTLSADAPWRIRQRSSSCSRASRGGSRSSSPSRCSGWRTRSIHRSRPSSRCPSWCLRSTSASTQWRSGVPSNPDAQLETLRNMSWESFSAAVCDAYRRQGYAVSPSREQGYDFTLTQAGRVTLLQCRRWKVNQVGAEPVRELARAIDRMQAYRGICLATGEFSGPARKIAASEPVALVSGAGARDAGQSRHKDTTLVRPLTRAVSRERPKKVCRLSPVRKAGILSSRHSDRRTSTPRHVSPCSVSIFRLGTRSA